MSTKAESLAHAKEVAEDRYLELCGKHKRGELKSGKSFNFVADQFEREYEIITRQDIVHPDVRRGLIGSLQHGTGSPISVDQHFRIVGQLVRLGRFDDDIKSRI
ncbi:MAG: hypothetical protein K2X43_06705 [Hyphomonadaceae bacterium]|jgi:hypothetical protein|nr:hypothetical protein [Hyphomonadaceae bacterium]